MKTFSKRFSLKGKNALVTGGVGFLGRTFCRALAASGANVAVVDLDAKTCRLFAEELREAYGIESKGFACDVSDPAQVGRMTQETAKYFGRIDVLHNNAATKGTATGFYASFERYTLAQWRKIMAVNLDGMFLVAQAVGKKMSEHAKGGSIIQTASIYGAMAPDPRIYKNTRMNTPVVYTTSKAGVIGLTKHLAVLWAKKNIRVNALIPGGVANGQDKVFIRNYSRRVPMGRMARPDEMAGALIFLASDASSYVTGQCLVVDGGLSAW